MATIRVVIRNGEDLKGLARQIANIIEQTTGKKCNIVIQETAQKKQIKDKNDRFKIKH